MLSPRNILRKGAKATTEAAKKNRKLRHGPVKEELAINS